MRTRTDEYRGFQIRSNPTSHRGTRMYEAAIYGARRVKLAYGGSTLLAEVAHGKTRGEAVAAAQRRIDEHLAGARALHNYATRAERLARVPVTR